MPSTTIDNAADVIDSRDIISRIAALQDERDTCTMLREDGTEEYDPSGWAEQNPEDAAELAALEDVQDQATQYAADWEYGVTLVRDSYFVEYAQELLQDCGDLPANLPPYLHIDWDATARDIRTDYTAVDFDNVTYWVR